MKKNLIILFLLALTFTIIAPSTQAKDKEYEAIVKHLQKSYQAKKPEVIK